MPHVGLHLASAAEHDDDGSLHDPEEWPPHELRAASPSPSGTFCLRSIMVLAVVALTMSAAALQHTILIGHSPAPPPLAPRVSRRLTTPAVSWRCTNANGSISVAATLPSVAHLALRQAHVLPADPLYRFNELAFAWVTQESWNFSAEFDARDASPVDSALLHTHRLVLELDGVDTVAEVRLNGALVGRPRSAFVRWRLPLPAGLLLAGRNRLAVSFAPPRAYAEAQSLLYPYDVPLTEYHHVWSEPSHRNFIRKPPSDFGWDWGPSFMPTGISGAISLHDDGAAIEYLSVAQSHLRNGSVGLDVRAVLSPGSSARCALVWLRVELCFPSCDAPLERRLAVASPSDCAAADDDEEEEEEEEEEDGADTRRLTGGARLMVEEPRLWWPWGHGEQNLYELRARLCLSAACAAGGEAPLAPQVTRRVGLRRVQLVQQPAAPPGPALPNGTSFFFRVNGVDIFVMGANLIPSHVFAPEETEQRWRWLLERAREANMNMVRVWGGGRYQPDYFYDLCDELGLMVWQEMMFACALYPRDEAFLELVRREVTHQVSRLATHPSIVVWGGNNENEAALRWYQASRDHRDLYVADFVKLYLDTVRPALLSSDADARPIVDTSPSNGFVSFQPYVKRWGNVGVKGDPAAGAWGDVHYYNYQADCEDPSTYPAARFVSEHGFQSFPSFRVYSAVLAPEDWSRDSPLLHFRMRHPDGDAQLLEMIARHFHVPPAGVASAESNETQRALFDSYLYLTQLQQARCYETAFTTWRKMRSEAAQLMGLLYWQLNDIWQGPSWSTLEYDGTPKLAHHVLRRVFAKLLVSGRLHAAGSAAWGLEVSLSSDRTAPTAGVLTVEVVRWDGEGAAVAARAQVVAAPSATSVAWGGSLSQAVASAGCDSIASSWVGGPLQSALCYVRLHFDPEAHVEAPDDGFAWLAPFTSAMLPRAHIRVVQVVRLEGWTANRARIVITSNATAAFVSIDSEAVPGAFNDGAFLLTRGSNRSLEFIAQEPFELKAFEKGLRVRSLRDTY